MNRTDIDSFDSEELNIYSKLSEVQLLRYYEPKPGIFIAESPNVIMRAIAAGFEPLSLLVQDDLYEKEALPITDKISEVFGDKKAKEINVYTAPLEVINQLTGFAMTRGILAAMRRKPMEDTEIFLQGKKRIAVLYDIVNPTNVGAIIRSAAALGMDGVMLTDDCADPFYRRAARVSMGTVFQIPLIKVDITIKKLNELGFATVAMALTDDSISVSDKRLKDAEKVAVVLGSEGEGLPKQAIDACTYTAKIPMYHGVDSLNVAAASAVAFYELCKTII
ncbi:MAG: RNA methyltransferase [Lachnospiraceae bacterium]|nr:RNA methyltransferase [Lachnospiraceae bacterium]